MKLRQVDVIKSLYANCLRIGGPVVEGETRRLDWL